MTAAQTRVEECLPHENPIERPDYTEFEVQSIRALYEGKASERQQLAILPYILRAAGTHDLSYRPGDSHATAFAEGKRFVGTTLVWMLKSAPARTDPDKIAARELDDGNSRPDNKPDQ
ncbi:MAG: hypothetical protein KAI25_07760 [Hyphomicrobiaceae bacterium]|nr:hypothetical protein [Hyphomicrobiaceae bacterium]